MTKKEVLDLYFLAARHNLVEIAAFIDRVERTNGSDDFRIVAFRNALNELTKEEPGCAKRVLLSFSDLTPEPIEKSDSKSAIGAFNPSQSK